MSSLFANPMRHWRVALAALFGGLLLSAPGKADASCGDYVLIGGRSAHNAAHMMQPGDAPSNSAEEGVPPARLPCHGPACSRDRAPLSAPAPTITVSIEEWACAGHGDALFPAASNRLPAAPGDLPEAGCGLSILRPPR